MAEILKVIVILTLCSFIGVKCQLNKCTQGNYDRCIRNVTPLIQAVDTFYIKYTVPRMRQLCDEYRSTKTCIQEFEHHCAAPTRNEIQSTHRFFDYICDQTFSVFERHRDCLVRPELEQRANSCNSTFFQSINRPSPGGLGNPCGHFNAYIACLSTEVKIICGQEAAEWQLGLDKAKLMPFLDPLSCNLGLENHEYCTNDNLHKCFGPLQQHPIEDGRHIVPTHTISNIVEICKSYTEVRPCVDLLINECHPQHQAYLRSLHDQYKYVCDDTLEEYFQHRDCLATPGLHDGLKTCHNDFDTVLQSVDYESKTVQAKYAKICVHANQMLDCVQDLVESFCGANVATWQRGLDIAVYQPLLDYFECKLSSDRSTALASTGGVTPNIISAIAIPVAVVIILLIAVLLIVFTCIKRNKKKSNSHQRMGEEQIPPPEATRVVYTVPAPVSVQEQGAMAALPPDLLPPEYTEKPQVGEMLLAAAIAYQTPAGDEVKLPLPPDDGEYETVKDVPQPPDYDDVDLRQHADYDDVDLGVPMRK